MKQQGLLISTFPITCIIQLKLYVAIATRVLIRLDQKYNNLFPPTCRCNFERIGLTASEEKSFENVDERTDGRRMPGYILNASAKVS